MLIRRAKRRRTGGVLQFIITITITRRGQTGGRASKLANCLATGREGRVGFETDDYRMGGRGREKSGGTKNAG